MAEQRRIRVAVVFGGRSSEHVISCVTAGSVLSAIDPERYEVIPVGITPRGDWVLTDGDPGQLAIRDGQLPEVAEDTGSSLALPFHPDGSGLLQISPGAGPAALGEVDVVLPLLHGPFGEDGTIQGLFEMVGTRYVGAGVLGSAACMDKVVLKVLLEGQGFTVGPYVGITDRQWRLERKRVLDDVAALATPGDTTGSTVGFVKPARAGSSVGITRVADLTDTDAVVAAIEAAREHDPKVLVEAAIEGREIECGVLESPDGGWPEVSMPAEIHVDTEHDFYDFEAKYLAESDLTIPAELPADVVEKLRRTAAAAFDAAECEGLARVDFFYGADGTIYLNEINTMPGFTPTSAFPQMWAASGVDYPALVDRLLRTALARRTGLR
ncbi:D-alanine--D-alanine ligase family protein [Lipingzhangella sp. LS1_29]|uniref:D-alanine--D-alanine ligase n=1 Tax=Lipingzhangella rawalii TaxID=2055835 RepID=A0ABU2H571_9ACTN|nr:D-alanine--D-alanine ligase family protein [Lipingzhangella rawalii]MDS1270457.1 D-alanine--D-alanine ligase family protein [Lipingzhangella rawalii]